MTTAERHNLNETRLKLIHPALRAKIAAILNDVETHDAEPLIDSGVWRSQSEQLEKYRKGFSKVKWSFHNATNPDGTPGSLAADITDARFGWNSPRSFWLMLASSAEAHGMQTGITWGLKPRAKAMLKKAIAARDFTRSDLTLGWDAAHVEVKGISQWAARAGRRPSV